MSKSELLLFAFILLTAGFSTSIQLLTLMLISIMSLLTMTKIKHTNRWFFYVLMITISSFQLFNFGHEDYGLNYIINTLIITFMWFFMLQSSNFILASVSVMNTEKLEKILINVFLVNFAVVVFQILYLCISRATINPFTDDAAGDHIKGVFSFSSSNMIVMGFYSVFFAVRKYYKFLVLAIVVMMLTFFMSGMLFFIAAIALYATLGLSFTNKMKVIAGASILILLFATISPGNITYVRNILTIKLVSKTDPIRKIVAGKQTYDYWTDSWDNFVFGAGGGKFSSRTAFITGGEYVSYPDKLIYRSSDFEKNHFPLWNNKILSGDFKDGTANQPFSFYNKIIGEYGLIGMILFIIYLSVFFRKYKKLTYGRLILVAFLFFLFLDYWFEYFSVVIFFELFLFLDLKNSTEKLALK